MHQLSKLASTAFVAAAVLFATPLAFAGHGGGGGGGHGGYDDMY